MYPWNHGCLCIPYIVNFPIHLESSRPVFDSFSSCIRQSYFNNFMSLPATRFSIVKWQIFCCRSGFRNKVCTLYIWKIAPCIWKPKDVSPFSAKTILYSFDDNMTLFPFTLLSTFHVLETFPFFKVKITDQFRICFCETFPTSALTVHPSFQTEFSVSSIR